VKLEKVLDSFKRRTGEAGQDPEEILQQRKEI
jgi:hypothetical protein